MWPGVTGDHHASSASRGDPHPQYALESALGTTLETLGIATFFPAALFDAKPNTGSGISTQVQYALDNVPAGRTLYFSPGTYIIDAGLTLTRSDVNIWLDPGVVWQSSGVVQLLNVQGTLTAVTTTLAANVSPEAQDAIQVSSTSSFFAGDWIYFQDGTDAADGTTSQIKSELARIRSVIPGAPGSITLYEPLVNGYLTAEGASITKVTPVENVSIMGGGKITNATDTGLGFRFEYTSRCSVQGIEFEGIDRECMRWRYSVGSRVSNCWMHDATRFDGSSGYGVTFTGIVGGTIAGNHASRLRHAYDVSYWSRQISVVNNVARAGAQAPLMVHPSVEGCVIVGNVVDGARGFASGTPSNEMGDATDATGCTVREGGKGIVIANNIIKNCNLAGIGLIHNGCQDIVVIGNHIENCNTENASSWGGIVAGPSTGVLPGLIIANNVVESCSRYGILCSVSNPNITSNQIRNIVGSTRYGILLAPRDSISVEDALVKDNHLTGCIYGIVLGGVDAGGSGSVVRPKIVNNAIFNMEKSGIYGRHNSLVILANVEIVGNEIYNVNSDDATDQAGIRWIEENSVGTDASTVLIARNTISSTARIGIYIGISDAVVEGNYCNAVSGSGGVGIGIWVRAVRSGTTVSRVKVMGNVASRCLDEGIRISDESGPGEVEDCVISRNECMLNGGGSQGGGILEYTHAADNLYANNICTDNFSTTSFGMLIKGDRTKAFWNVSGNTGVGAQDYGIRIESTATGTILHDNHCFGNTNTDISDGGTATRWDADQYQTTGASGTTTLTERVRYHGVTGTSGGTVTLPAIANVPDGHQIIVKDEGGNAGTSNITVTAAGTDQLDGTATGTVIIAVNYAKAGVFARGGKWWTT